MFQLFIAVHEIKDILMRLVAITGFFLLCLLPAFVCASTGHLTQVSGLVSVYSSQSGEWVNGSSGLAISPGDRVKTSENGAAILSYSDGSELRINKSSSIQILAAGYRLRYGNTWVRFVKQGNHFRTITPNAVVSVRGTIYTVEVKRDFASIVSDWKATVGKAPFIADAPKAHVASSSLLLSLLSGAGTVSSVNVYRGTVAVSSVSDNGTESVGKETLVTKGLGLYVSGNGISVPENYDISTEKIWGSDFNEQLKIPAGSSRKVRTIPVKHDVNPKGSGKTFKLLGVSPLTETDESDSAN